MSVFETSINTPYSTNFSVFTPSPSNCRDKWCNNPGMIPATGQMPIVAKCGDAETMEYQKNTYGGLTGRGVTPCPFGYLQKTPWIGGDTSRILIPYQGKYFNEFSQSSIFFDPDRYSWLPPQGNPRPLNRIGYEWRN